MFQVRLECAFNNMMLIKNNLFQKDTFHDWYIELTDNFKNLELLGIAVHQADGLLRVGLKLSAQTTV